MKTTIPKVKELNPSFDDTTAFQFAALMWMYAPENRSKQRSARLPFSGKCFYQIGEDFGGEIEWLECFKGDLVMKGTGIHSDELEQDFEYFDPKVGAYRRYDGSEHLVRILDFIGKRKPIN